jgi:hypothetical protein
VQGGQLRAQPEAGVFRLNRAAAAAHFPFAARAACTRTTYFFLLATLLGLVQVKIDKMAKTGDHWRAFSLRRSFAASAGVILIVLVALLGGLADYRPVAVEGWVWGRGARGGLGVLDRW